MPDEKLERRSVLHAPRVEMRAQPGSKEELPMIVGYACVFNEISRPVEGLFYELVEPGAFRAALQAHDTRVTACTTHQDALIPLAMYRGGRQVPGTLSLREDDKGLLAEFHPANTYIGQGIVESIRRGDTDGMSFQFRAQDEDWQDSHNGLPLRRIKSAKLYDICVTHIPYYDGTNVSLRSLSNQDMGKEDYENLFLERSKQSELHLKRANEIRARRLRLLDLQQ